MKSSRLYDSEKMLNNQDWGWYRVSLSLMKSTRRRMSSSLVNVYVVALQSIISLVLYLKLDYHQKSGSPPTTGQDSETDVMDSYPPYLQGADINSPELYRATYAANREMASLKEAAYLKELLESQQDECVALDKKHVFDISWGDWIQNNSWEDPEGYRVPNVVHYIYTVEGPCEPHDLNYTSLISILSVHNVLKPKIIMLHTNCAPIGPIWDIAQNTVNSLWTMQRSPVKCAFGFMLISNDHPHLQNDIDKLSVLMEYGGIVLDLSVVVLRTLDPLRHYPCTVGMFDHTRAATDIIVSSRTAEFLMMWINFYNKYSVQDLPMDSGVAAARFARRYPFLVRLEWDGVCRWTAASRGNEQCCDKYAINVGMADLGTTDDQCLFDVVRNILDVSDVNVGGMRE